MSYEHPHILYVGNGSPGKALQTSAELDGWQVDLPTDVDEALALYIVNCPDVVIIGEGIGQQVFNDLQPMFGTSPLGISALLILGRAAPHLSNTVTASLSSDADTDDLISAVCLLLDAKQRAYQPKGITGTLQERTDRFVHPEKTIHPKGEYVMKWITRERVKVDRVACPWLIKKFVDPQAEFLFVPADQVMVVAEREGATPYDVKGMELGHHGQECSFEAILKKYNLTNDPALVLLGKIVNGADTDNTLWNQPEGAGLEAVAEGFRHLGYKDDHEQNAAEWIVYDALYAYCQESVKQGKPDGMFKGA